MSLSELILALFLSALLSSASVASVRTLRLLKPTLLVKEIEGLLEKERLLSAFVHEIRTVYFDIEKQEIRYGGIHPKTLSAGHSLQSAAFGVASQSTTTATCYPSGTCSPGTITLARTDSASCRIVISLYGAVRHECT